MDQVMDKDMEQGLQGEGQEAAAQETMESMMEQYDISGLRKGDVRTGTVIAETENGWLVDVGYKCEGYLPGKEWTHRILVGDAEKPKKGDEIEVQVINLREGEEAQLLLSRWRHEFDRRWAEFEDKLAQNEIVQVRGVRKVKGGLMVDCCGLEGFMPISHLSADGRGVNLGNFIEQVFDAKLLEKDRRKHRIVFSRKSLVEKEAAERRAKFYEEVHEGDIIEGEVSSLTDFGVFVNVGAVDGLVHMSEITWKRNVRIRDSFKKGDKVTVKVIGIDKENDRISLSIKQVEGNPWLTVGERIHKDDVMTGTVTNVTDFGAFVELEPGIEGLVHIGDISWARIRHPKEAFRKGQEVRVLVLDVDTEKRRISLGYKQLNDPWKDIDQRYAKGSDITVKVVRLADFGAFVEVEEGVEALIHISQLSTRRVEKPGDVLQEKQEVLARVIEVNPEQRRMRLSISALEEQDHPARHGEESHHKREEPRENRRQQQNAHDEEPQFNPFADAFRSQDFSR
ncbi:MAG: S1 RNA-binding domain-containing protein [Fretibacterium sp.]